MAKAPKIGDIIEIDTEVGFAYAQFTHMEAQLGSLVRVLPDIHVVRPTNFDELVLKDALWVMFVPLGAIVRAAIFPIVANGAVPPAARTFPLMRAGAHLPNGEVRAWWLFDGEREWRIPELTPEHAELSIVEIPNPALIRQRIAAGWHPRLETGRPRVPTHEGGAAANAGTGAQVDDPDVHSAAVVIEFTDVGEELRAHLYRFEDALQRQLGRQQLGEVDGNRAGVSSHEIFIYGPDLDRIRSALKPLLLQWGLARTARVHVRARHRTE